MNIWKIVGEEHSRKLGVYLINDEAWFSPWYYQSLQFGNYRLPNGEYPRGKIYEH